MSGSLGLILLFLAVFGGSFMALRWFQGQGRPAREVGPEEEEERKLVLGEMTEVLAAQVPLGEEGEEELAPELREAGFYSSTALMEYAAIRSVLVIVPLIAAVVAALFVPRPFIPATFVVGLLVSALGYALPRVYVNQVARARKREMERGLPVAVDMLALALTGGQTLYAALQRVANEIRFSFPVLARELEIVRHHTRLRSLEFALRHWAYRVRIPEVRQLVGILTSAERLGQDVCAGLLEFSEHYRITQRQRADAQANRASVLLIFPMLLGLWLPAAVILVAPILFEFHARGQVGMQAIQESTAQRQRMEAQFKRIQSPGTQPTQPAPSPEPTLPGTGE